MGSTVCANDSCGATNSHEWKIGWPLGSGGFCHLCFICGTAYENSIFCQTFHSEETGWRDCSSCGKKIHCGCVVSRYLYEFQDYSGVRCKTCASSARICLISEVPKGYGGSRDVSGSNTNTSMVAQNRVVGDNVDQGRLMQLCKIMEANETNVIPRFQTPESNESLGQSQTKQQHDVVHNLGEVSREFPSLVFSKPDNSKSTSESKSNDRHDALLEASLSMSLGTPLSFALPSLPREQSKTPSPSFDQQRSRPIMPKPHLKPALTLSLESNKGAIPPMRIARPPGEGRGKNQLLPRYWPRITDQELEQLAGDLNSSIVPLFEKVLSASDAGRIGRLVLPKACAEAYFPPISQSEGVPLRIQDVKGNDWTFQFRYWPNNNSRMYVLEGVTPCIQAMQLQAGDTVTFSRIDPGGKLIMGFRKATNNGDMQESYASTLSNSILGDSSFSENLPSGNGFSNILPQHPNNFGDGDTVLRKSESNGFRAEGDSQHQPSEKKRARNIGSKSKRLLMHSEDVLELRLTWEEAQDLLRPPTAANPSIVIIEGHEFEEYDEPPVFGKRTFFVSRPSGGGQEQWAQCDECSKWRKLPLEVVLPSKWSCSDNDWDSIRGLCSAPEEMSLKGLETLLRAGKDSKKRITESRKAALQREPSGLDALASAAVFGDSLGEEATTTRHPRHRPGCSCIVCIQPPSGKGKHKPTCTCNVCMTVRRRFKTLMLRKKKRHSDRPPNPNPTHNDAQPEASAGIIDLNSHPGREDEPEMTSPVDLADVASTELRGYDEVSGFDVHSSLESARDRPEEDVADWERDNRDRELA